MSVTKMESSLSPPPFLTKTFDMVDDSHTDSIVSWSPSSNIGFVVWDFYEFSGGLLPQFFKHSNFASFVRQLNTYGFRKADPDRWEFSHEEFRKGQRYRLKNIHRKRPATSSNSMALVPTGHRAFAHVGISLSQAWKGVGSYQAVASEESEIERLKIEIKVMMLELGRLRGKHQAVHQQMKYMSDRLQALKMGQQQTVASIARTLCTPSVLYEYVHQAITADRIRSWDANSSKARKRPRILSTDAHLCRIESGISANYTNGQLQLQPKSEKGQGDSCETAGMWMTTGTDDKETSASYDQKQMSDQREFHTDVCVDNRVAEGDYADAASVYQNAGSSQAGGASSAFSSVVEDAEREINTCIEQPVMKVNGAGLATKTECLETTVDLNWQPFALPDSFSCSAKTHLGTGETQVPQGSSNNYFQDLENELFWGNLFSPPATSRRDCSRNRSECALVECFGLMNEQEALFSRD